MNSLGFDKKPEDTRVVVAMSGGVDSSTVAAMLHDEGYEVIGITLQLYDHGAVVGKKGACCAGQDIYDAKRVADGRGFPHYVLDYESRFKETVIEEFADAYLQGQTPIPCVRCNQEVKFKDLLATARDLGADCLATGHYIQRDVKEDGKAVLLKGADPTKDQSYFLFATTQEQIDFLRFPLGGNMKSDTRAIAEKYGLQVADKPDSQDICFVPNGDYAGVVTKLRPQAIKSGPIVHEDGRELGKHLGIINYTIGQRRGLKLGGAETQGEPLYVVRLDPENNAVIVGPKESLARKRIIITLENWVGDAPLVQDFQDVSIKFRSVMSPMAAKVRLSENERVEVILNEPQYGISPGQACVCYDGERVLGGGWIIDSLKD